jgi:hypothetical protein
VEKEIVTVQGALKSGVSWPGLGDLETEIEIKIP